MKEKIMSLSEKNMLEQRVKHIAEDMPSTKQMRRNMKNVMVNWDLGPGLHKATPDPKANTAYWRGLAIKWAISVEHARAKTCSNCEHGRISPVYQMAMTKYPYSMIDTDGGQRVWCEKFDFVCHSLRTCQAHERD